MIPCNAKKSGRGGMEKDGGQDNLNPSMWKLEASPSDKGKLACVYRDTSIAIFSSCL
jgi:hypothetical protein